MSSSNDNTNSSDGNNNNTNASNIFGSSTKSSISNLFTSLQNSSEFSNEASNPNFNLSDPYPFGSSASSKPMQGETDKEQPSGLAKATEVKPSDSETESSFVNKSSSFPAERKDGVVLVTLSERLDPAMYDLPEDTKSSNTFNDSEESKDDESSKLTVDTSKNISLFTDTRNDENTQPLNLTFGSENTETQDDLKDPTSTILVKTDENKDFQQGSKAEGTISSSESGTSALLETKPPSTTQTFDLVENEHTSKLTESNVSSKTVSLTESLNGPGSFFGDANKPGEFATEGSASKSEFTSSFLSPSSTEKQTSLFGLTAPSTLFGNQETKVESKSNDAPSSFVTSGTSLFGKIDTAGTSGNIFGSAESSASSLFGGTSTNVLGTGTASSNLFVINGTTSSSVNLFGNSESAASNMFGKPDTTSTTTSNLFGTTDSASTSNLFSKTDTPVSSTNLFGSTTEKSSVSDLFGKSDTSTGNLFGSTTTTAVDKPSTSDLFSTTEKQSTTNNLFSTTDQTGTDKSSSNLFGSSASSLTGTTGVNFLSSISEKPTTTTNMFETSGSTDTSGSSIFGKTDTTEAPSATNLFGATDTSGSSGLFAKKEGTSTSSLFGSVTEQAPTTSSLFDSSADKSKDDAATSNVNNLFSTTSSTNLLGDKSASSNLFSTGTTSVASNLFGTTDSASTSNLFSKTDTPVSSTNLFGSTTEKSSVSDLFGKSDTSTGNLFGSTTTTAVDKPSTSDLFSTTEKQSTTNNLFSTTDQTGTSNLFSNTESASTASNLFSKSDSQTPSNNLFGAVTSVPTASNVFGTASNNLATNESVPRVRFNLPSETTPSVVEAPGVGTTFAATPQQDQYRDATRLDVGFSATEQHTISNLLDSWERRISKKVDKFNSFADRVATIDQQIVLQCNNINGLLNMHKELLDKHRKMESLIKVIEEEQKMALSVLDNMEKVLNGKLESLNTRSNNYNVTQAITRNLQELTDQLTTTTKMAEDTAQVCQPEPIFTIAKILSFHQISLIDLEKQCDEIDSRIRSMQRRV